MKREGRKREEEREKRGRERETNKEIRREKGKR